MDLREVIIKIMEEREVVSLTELIDILRNMGYEVKAKELYAELWELERIGMLKRRYDESFDILKPATTVKWSLRKKKAEIEERKKDERDIKLVISVPPLLGDFKEYCNKFNALYFLEALELIIISAENTLRIMCPYIDQTLSNLLVKADLIRRGDVNVRILSERRSKISYSSLEYIKMGLRNVDVRYADAYDESGFKKTGVHAKCVSADDKMLLLGSFNITVTHIITDLDLGLLIFGPIVKTFNKMFDEIWEFYER